MKVALAAIVCALTLTRAYSMEPFGLDAVPSTSSGLIRMWGELRLEFAQDQEEIQRCRREPCGSPAAKLLISIVDEARRYGGRQMIGHLNRSINSAIPAARADVPWLAPLAALSRAGDCKSYAITKYMALAESGIAAEDRRLVLLRVIGHPELHLAVLVRDGERWLILDNRTLILVDSTSAHQYTPLHEFDENGVRDFR